MRFLRLRRSGRDGGRRRRGRRVSLTVTEAMYDHLREKGDFFGSMSGYLRYLIMSDMEGGFSVRTVRVVERERVAEVSSVSGSTPRPAPPSAPPMSPPSSVSVARVSVQGAGYGGLHAELIAELKQKFKGMRVE